MPSPWIRWRRALRAVAAALAAALDRIFRCERCGGPGGTHLVAADEGGAPDAQRWCARCVVLLGDRPR